MTTKDQVVPVRKQRALAEAAGGRAFESPIDHMDVVSRAADYNDFLVQARGAVAAPRGLEAAGAGAPRGVEAGQAVR